MATLGTFSVQYLAKGVVMAQWTGLVNALGVGRAFDGFEYPDKTVVLAGTIGSGTTVLIEGSSTATNPLVTGGATVKYYTLTDQSDNALSLSTGKAEVIAQNTKYIRPRVSAMNANTNVSVTIIAQSARR